MKSLQKPSMKGIILLLVLLSFGLSSCKKSKSNETTDQQGPAKVIVQMLGVDENGGSLEVNGAGGGKRAVNAQMIQTQVVPFNEDYVIEAMLVPEGIAIGTETNRSLSTNAIKPVLGTAAITQTPLTTGVRYKVLVFGADSHYVTFKDFVRGSEGTDGIALDDGKTYTFVAYSVNSTTALPDAGLTTASTLSTSNLTGVSGDLMYFSTQMTVTAAGPNNLGVILKHKYNRITPKISLDNTMIGNIEAISGVAFGGTTSPSADMNLGTGVLTYNTNYVLTAAASFTGIGTTTVTGSPILVINKGTSAAVPGTSRLAIGSITIAGVTRTGLSISGLSITPGVKYNLNLTIHRNCNASILLINTAPNELNLPTNGTTTGNTITQSLTYPFLQNQGPFTRIVFYIRQTTSAFDIMINNVHLISNTANTDHYFHFNNSTTTGEITNVTFSDNTKYGTGGISPIETLSGTNAIIQIDVVVGTAGTLIAASKTTNGALLSGNKLLSTYHFNSINWNQTASNTVVITQLKTTSVPAPFFQAKAGGITSPCTN